jgi:hypothetical protein
LAANQSSIIRTIRVLSMIPRLRQNGATWMRLRVDLGGYLS